MNAITVFCIVSILGICMCGDPKESANVESPESFEVDVESPEDTFSDGTESEDPQDPSIGGENVTSSEGTEDGPDDAPEDDHKQTTLPSSSDTLDIANPDTSKISSVSGDIDGLKSTLYESKDDHYITPILDSGVTIWRESGNERCKTVNLFSRGSARFLTVYLEGQGEPKYFGNNGQGWKSLEKSEFDKGLNGEEYKFNEQENENDEEYIIIDPKYMIEEVKVDIDLSQTPSNVILDLKSPDTRAFQCIDCHVDSVPTRLYMPNECHTIKSVVVDGVELWKGTFCPLVLLHHVNNNPKFARIITEEPAGASDILYYVKKNQWIKIPSNTSMTSLKSTVNTIIGVIVDINYPPSSIDQVKTNWCGLDVQLFVPKCLHYAKEVCFSNEQIWKGGKDDEKCILIIVHLEHEIPITVHLLVRDKNGAVNSLYYVRDGLFKTSNGMEYYNKIAVVRSENCKCQQWTCCV